MATLKIVLHNGMSAEAPIEEWMAALLAAMPDEIRTRVVQKMEENRGRGSWTSAGRAVARPARGYVLEAEPGRYGLRR